MPTNPDSFDVEQAAQFIYAEIIGDMGMGAVPATVTTFTDLHSHVDANEYLLCMDVPWGADVPPTDADPNGNRVWNAVCDRVNALMVDGAPFARMSDGDTVEDAETSDWVRTSAGDSQRCAECGKYLAAGGPAMVCFQVTLHLPCLTKHMRDLINP